MTKDEASRRAGNFMYALDQYLGAREAVKQGGRPSLASQTRAFLHMATSMLIEDCDA